MKIIQHLLPCVLSLFAVCGCASQTTTDNKNTGTELITYVDPHIGSGGHGHVFVGANVPFGMVQLGPTSIPQEWDFVSGYHQSDSTVIGFSHTHLSGTGIGDLFDITVMPVTGEVTYARGTDSIPNSGLWSYQNRSQEVCQPGYYSTFLTRYQVKAELTATERVGFHRYTYNNPEKAGLVFDLQNGGCWDTTTEAFVEQVDDTTIRGYRYSKGWASNQKVYFAAKLDRPLDSIQVHTNNTPTGNQGKGEAVYAHLYFQTNNTQQVNLAVALSPTSMEQAQNTLSQAVESYTFEVARAQAQEKWNKELAKINIVTKDEKVKRTFYTALYHTMIAPSLFCDPDGSYYGADFKNHPPAQFTNYTTFSLWDTYRAAHPLMTLIHPEIMPHIVQTFLHIYNQQGKLPIWHLWGCETNTMVGNPGICVLADAVLKGFVDDPEAAFQAMKASAMLDERGQKARKQFGYLPKDIMKESVAYDMEYAIADWAVAQVAKMLGHEEDYQYFQTRSQSYRHLFDPTVGFVRGKDSKGQFGPLHLFDPYSSEHRDDDYCEGNAWQYTFLVPHDVQGLVKCFGTKERFMEKLDSLFTVDSTITGGEASPDISGLIGQYAHGNEPSHHTIYLYNLIGHPEKSAPLLRQVLHTLYNDQPDGLSGNEDVGQMSAWYILSAMGLYQVEPAGGRYYFGSPILDEAALQVANGTFTIKVHNNSNTNIYIQKVQLNGEPYNLPYINYKDITAGGLLEFFMAAEPTPNQPQ